MQKKHIVIVTKNFVNGGTERRATVLANSFAEKGYDVTYLVLEKIYSDVVYELADGVELICMADFARDSVALKEKKQATVWRDKKFKYLHILHRLAKLCGYDDLKVKRQKNNLEGIAFLRAFALCKREAIFICFGIGIYEKIYYAIQGLNCKIIFTDASSPDFKDNKENMRLYNKVLLKLLKKGDYCVFQTTKQKEYYGKCVKRNSKVIKNPLTTQLSPFFSGERQHTIVNFCRTHPVKNLILLVDAFSRFSVDFPDYVLHIYGATSTRIAENYKAEVIKHINDLGISEKVEIFEAVTNIHQQIEDYGMFVSSSDSEGLSNSMIEAMAMGLPCICTDCLGGGAREMITDGENGLLVPVKDVDALYKAMCRMASEEGLAERCGKNAYKVREELSVENIVNQWLNVIESL